MSFYSNFSHNTFLDKTKNLPLAQSWQTDSGAAWLPSVVGLPNTRPDLGALARHSDSCLDAIRVRTAASDVAFEFLAFRAFPAGHSNDDWEAVRDSWLLADSSFVVVVAAYYCLSFLELRLALSQGDSDGRQLVVVVVVATNSSCSCWLVDCTSICLGSVFDVM